MSVIIGEVTTFPNTTADKAQIMKVAEEYLEVFSAWENREQYLHVRESITWMNEKEMDYPLIDECADLIQAVSNLLAGLGVSDMTDAMEECRKRNEERGRL